MNEEEKQAIKDTKDILKELNKHKDKDFIGRLYYKNKPIEDILQILLNLIEKQQKEIEELSIIKSSIQTLETDFVNDYTYYVIAKENFLEGDFRHLLDDYISKDIIKELKEIDNIDVIHCKFKKLLGE